VTAGQGGLNKTLRYTDRLQRWADASGLKFKVHNGGFPAIDASYLSSCLNLHAPIDSDIVIVELALNDKWSYDPFKGNKIAFELLIRKILSRPSSPAVILLNGYQHSNNLPSEEQGNLYLYNAEAFYFDVSSFYGLQLASVKAAAWHLSKIKGFWINSTVWSEELKGNNKDANMQYLFHDNYHFTAENGHRVMFELLLGLLLHTSRQLLAQPHNELSDDGPWTGLPEIAIFQENAVSLSASAETCLVGKPLRRAAFVTKGFEWINEAAAKNGSKWGFTSFEKDSELSIKMSTDMGGGKASKHVSVVLGYLRSYEKMGIFAVQCSAGCICDKQLIDGHDPSRHVSTLQMHKFQVISESPSCTFTISTQPNSNSGSHKVKIGALVLDGGGGRTWQQEGVLETMVEAVTPQSSK
jgi:hypothetical protein